MIEAHRIPRNNNFPFLWFLLIVFLIGTIGVVWSNSSPPQICEMCGRTATALVKDKEGYIHPLCDEHSGDMILGGWVLEGKP